MDKLELYVMDDCVACQRATTLAARAAAQFPQVEVAVINMDRSGAEVPTNVFAAPTFRLNGRVISLGTPEWGSLAAQLRDPLAI